MSGRPWRIRQVLLAEFAQTYRRRDAETVTAAVARTASRIGVTERTGWRYLSTLRKQGPPMALPTQIDQAVRGDHMPPPGSEEERRAAHVLALPAGTPEAEAAERRAAAEWVADWAAQQHPCELSKKNGVRACRHPDHARDADLAREFLLALGLTKPPAKPAPPPTREETTRSRVIARCPVCHTRQKVKADGTVGLHSDGGWQCDGYGQPPVIEEQAR